MLLLKMVTGGGEIILLGGGVKWGCYGRMQSYDVLGLGLSGGWWRREE